MIGYLKGEIAAIYEDRVIIEVSGVGYNVFMPATSLDLIDGVGINIRIYTYLSVREDAMTLYGFLTKDDLDLYRMLITVNGIGPKGALSLLSVMTAEQLRFAILSGDAKQIGKAPGVGPKTAQRVIIDLKDRIDTVTLFDTSSYTGNTDKGTGHTLTKVFEEAAEALTALGYSQSDSYKAVKSIDAGEDPDVETVLKLALSYLS